jgi:hypothetical protein
MGMSLVFCPPLCASAQGRRPTCSCLPNGSCPSNKQPSAECQVCTITPHASQQDSVALQVQAPPPQSTKQTAKEGSTNSRTQQGCWPRPVCTCAVTARQLPRATHGPRQSPDAADLAAAAAAAKALHTDLCTRQCFFWQALLQYRAIRSPAHTQLREPTI